MLKGLGGRSDPAQTNKITEIKTWVRELLPLAPETSILVTELACTEPGCPPLETVVAVLKGPGENVQQKIHRSVVEITKEDIVTLCERLARVFTPA